VTRFSRFRWQPSGNTGDTSPFSRCKKR